MEIHWNCMLGGIHDFLEERAPTPKGAAGSTHYLTIFSENCMKMKKFWPRGVACVPQAANGTSRKANIELTMAQRNSLDGVVQCLQQSYWITKFSVTWICVTKNNLNIHTFVGLDTKSPCRSSLFVWFFRLKFSGNQVVIWTGGLSGVCIWRDDFRHRVHSHDYGTGCGKIPSRKKTQFRLVSTLKN